MSKEHLRSKRKVAIGSELPSLCLSFVRHAKSASIQHITVTGLFLVFLEWMHHHSLDTVDRVFLGLRGKGHTMSTNLVCQLIDRRAEGCISC